MARTKTTNAYRVHVGTPPERFEGWSTINICFHGFADLTTTREEYVESPKFPCFGHQWRLDIYPGGDNGSPEGYVAVDICNMTDASIKIQYGFSVRDADGKEVVHRNQGADEFKCVGAGNNAWGFANFAKRSAIKELLVQGTLVIEVRMKLPCTGSNDATQFIPTNPINKNVLELFNEEETADLVFEVGGEHQTAKGRSKRAKTAATNFYAHRNILLKCAPILYEMCKSDESGEGITTISITDVTPEIFEFMLYYAYGGKLSDEDLKTNAKHIINACDKYGVVNLKLEAEACYVNTTIITINNMIDILLYADSKNLALLKEAVMDYIIENKHSIIGKVSFSDVPSD